ncbi:hypothetical protein SF12_05325, partial [Streptomyces sp. MBRL 601]
MTTARTWSMATVVPGETSSSVTVPACGAQMRCSIFIASTTSRPCPSSTSSPTATLTSVTVPGIGAVSAFAPAARSAPASASATGSTSVTCQASPSRASHCPARRKEWRTPSRVTATESAVTRWVPGASAVYATVSWPGTRRWWTTGAGGPARRQPSAAAKGLLQPG